MSRAQWASPVSAGRCFCKCSSDSWGQGLKRGQQAQGGKQTKSPAAQHFWANSRESKADPTDTRSHGPGSRLGRIRSLHKAVIVEEVDVSIVCAMRLWQPRASKLKRYGSAGLVMLQGVITLIQNGNSMSYIQLELDVQRLQKEGARISEPCFHPCTTCLIGVDSSG